MVAEHGIRRMTARDVAAELGVSVKTVGNAFNRPDQLSAALRARVLETAARLGYGGPDPIAAGLRGRRVGAIGVAYANGLSYAFEDSAAHEVLVGASGAFEPAGAGVLLLPGSEEADRRSAAVTGAVIDGLLAYSLADDDPLLLRARARALPLGVVDQPRPDRIAALGLRASWVGVDDAGGASAIAEHLLALGHRRIGVVSFALRRHPERGIVEPADQEGTYAVTRDRIAGIRAAAARHGLDWATVPVWQGTDSTPAEGSAGAAALIATEPRPTALLCLSDRLAEGAVAHCRALGLRVPADVSVTGFDDAGPAAALGLTTVRQPHREKGRLAARLLLDAIDGAPPMALPALPGELIVRASSGSPAA